jgi:hypothetical protein
LKNVKAGEKLTHIKDRLSKTFDSLPRC